MPFYLLTFRPQPSEFTLLDTFYTIVKPQLQDNPNVLRYAIVVEKDGTIDRHCHTFVEFKETKSKGNQLTQFYNKKVFNDFREMFKNTLTKAHCAFDNKKVKDTKEDFLHTLGYVLKEVECIRREYTFSEEDCVEAIEYYYQHKKIDKSKPVETDLKIMTSKNIHVNILDYCKKHDMRPRDRELVQLSMTKAGYMFSQVNVKNTFQEIDVHMNPDDYEDKVPEELQTYSELADGIKHLQGILELYEKCFTKLEHLTAPSNSNLTVSSKTVYDIVTKRDLYFALDD